MKYDGKKVLLFLGAGASVPYGKPTTKELMEIVLDRFEKNLSTNGNYVRMLKFLTAMIKFGPFEDIEYVFQALEDILVFMRTHGGEFLFNNNDAIFPVGIERYYQLSRIKVDCIELKDILEKELYRNYRWNKSFDPILDRICNKVFALVKEFGSNLHIFTTNYDRAVEVYCRNSHIRCVDGFKYDPVIGSNLWNNGDYSYADAENGEKIFLYKLHGSLDWKEHTDLGIIRTDIEESYDRSTTPTVNENILISPTLSHKDRLKKSPFSEIQQNLEKRMTDADCCIVIGFSFRDYHIVKLFEDFIKDGKRLIVISPTALINLQNIEGFSIKLNKHDMSYNKVSSMGRVNNIGFISKRMGPDSVEEITEIARDYLS